MRFFVTPTANAAHAAKAAPDGSGSPRESARFRRLAGLIVALLLFVLWITSSAAPAPVLAQSGGPTSTPSSNAPPVQPPDQVTVLPVARDEQIRQRLQNILEATGWFVIPKVEVKDGVVFLTGETKTADYKKWAGDLARNTQDVVAVVNQMTLTQPKIWDFEPGFNILRDLWFSFMRSLPVIGFSLLVLLVTWLLARLSVRVARATLRHRIPGPLLNKVTAYAIGTMVFLIGLYVVFQVAGLADVALTVLGGTGLVGLVLGIAFRDITENFLSSIFLSVQNPFRSGDLVDIAGTMGFVQTLNTRTTILMTLDGNHVQIPNTTVYKSVIRNFTSNPNIRMDFMIGVGYTDSLTAAQEVAMNVLREHPAVLKDPEPMVLVDNLGAATVNLRIYFWVDGSQHSGIKVKSSVIRLITRAFQKADISMPDEAREMIFPEGVTVNILHEDQPAEEADTLLPAAAQHYLPPAKSRSESPASVATTAEADLTSEAETIQQQARHSRQPEAKENLLEPEGKQPNH